MAAVDVALITGSALLGLAGAPHCAAMCGGTSAGVIGRCGAASRRSSATAFHAGRALSYSVAGALAAASLGALRAWSEVAPVMRPLWTMVQAAVLAFGVWLAVTGRQPAWLSNRPAPLPAAMRAGGWQAMAGPARSGAAGAAWVAWPCGLLQSALVAATFASTPLWGAAVMAVFAATSSAGLWGAHLVIGRSDTGWAVRTTGVLLAVAGGWALGHGVWDKLAAYC